MIDIKDYASFKRLLEYYAADSNIRERIESKQFTKEDCLQYGLVVSDLEAAILAIKVILFESDRSVANSNPYYLEFLRINSKANENVNNSLGDLAFNNRRDLYNYCQLTFRRCGMEKEVIRKHPNIRYFPLGFELSAGCKVQCDFCGFDAERFKANCEYKDNRQLWRDVLKASKEVIGDVAKTASLYFATEPFDNPDYISFLEDCYEVLGDIPQTTTALADAYPDRVRRIIEIGRKISPDNYRYKAYLRFSVRDLKQLKRIYDIYSPEEIVDIELIINNPESVNRYSNSGRLKNNEAIENWKRNEYSICCISGIKVNMVNRCMEFIEPEVPSNVYPKGYRVRESIIFNNIKEYTNGLEVLYNKYAVSDIPIDRPLALNTNIKEVHINSKIAFIGDNINIAFADDYVMAETIKMIKEGKYVRDIVSSLGLFGDKKELLFTRLNRMFRNGYIRLM